MTNDTKPDSPTDEKLKRELEALAEAERDPDTAMAEGKRDGPSSEPPDPLNPKTHDTGENYLGHETIFTRNDSPDGPKP